MNKVQYDIIILGGGGAGLSLALSIVGHEALQDLSILIIEQESKLSNDRTWCYWEAGSGAYDHLLTHRWPAIHFRSDKLAITKDIAPYEYKMLRSADFYSHAYDILDASAQVNRVQAKVEKVESQTGTVRTSQDDYQGIMIFNSIVDSSLDLSKHLHVIQHFGGWFLESEQDIFDDGVATFMDFDIDQAGEHRFFYVLPMTKRRALVEMATFSNNVLSNQTYDELIEQYMSERYPQRPYQIHEKEYGQIPMTNYPFWEHNEGCVYHIGTAGGAVKPSSGFAFNRIQRHSQAIVDCLASGKDISQSYRLFKGKSLLYDSILLHVLTVQGVPGAEVFSDLFKNATPQQIFRFLDGDSSLWQDVGIFRAPSMWPFVKGMAKVVG